MTLGNISNFDLVNGFALAIGVMSVFIAVNAIRKSRSAGENRLDRLPKSLSFFIGQQIAGSGLIYLLTFGHRDQISVTMQELIIFMLLCHGGAVATMMFFRNKQHWLIRNAGGAAIFFMAMGGAFYLHQNAYPREAMSFQHGYFLFALLPLGLMGSLSVNALRKARNWALILASGFLITLSMALGQALFYSVFSIQDIGMPGIAPGMDATRLQFMALFNMLSAFSISVVMGDNPRYHWRRYAVTVGLVSVFSLLVYQSTDRSMNETAHYFELTRLVESVKGQRYELREIADTYNSGDRNNMGQRALPYSVFDKIEKFNETLVAIDQELSRLDKADAIRNFYYQRGVEDTHGHSLRDELSEFSVEIKTQLGILSPSASHAPMSNHEFDSRLSEFSQLILKKARTTNHLQVLVKDMSFVSGVFIVLFMALGVFLPAHASTVRALNALEEEKARVYKLALCAEHTTKGIVTSDEKGRVTWMNDAFTEISGFTLNDLKGAGLIQPLRHPNADMVHLKSIMADVLKGNSGEIEVIARHKNGEDLWLKISVSPVEEDGKIFQFVHVIEDVTQERAVQESLDAARRESERLALIARHASDGMAILGPDFSLSWVNPAMENLTGYSLEELREKSLAEFLTGPLTDRRKVNELLTDVQQYRECTGELLVYPKKGAPYWIEAIHTPLFDDEGVFAGMIVVHRDITERKNLEFELISHRDELAARVEERTQTIRNQALELEKALDRERELNRMQTEFVSMASHEFRTPLTIIDGLARRLEKRADRMTSDDIRERSQNIRNTVKRMTMLVERTLDASRLSSGRIKLTPEAFDLHELVTEVVDRQREVATGHDISMDLTGLPTDLFGDARLLDNVFTNIVSNAVKYAGDSKKVEIIGGEECGYAVLHVRDHGIGIPEDELNKIFQRFFRASTSTGIPGTGIGLNLVKSLVEMHYGEVDIKSEVGEWTEVTVRLPLESPLKDQKNIPDGEDQTDVEKKIA